MYDLFRITLCHPRLIGVYYKDRFFKIFAYVLFMFLITVCVGAIRCFSTDYFNMNDNNEIVMIFSMAEPSDALYDGNTKRVTGSVHQIVSKDYGINMLNGDAYSNSKVVLNFKENSLSIFYGGNLLKDISYNEFNVKSFSFEEVHNCNSYDVIEFKTMLDKAFDIVNTSYALFDFLNLLINILIIFIAVVIVSFVFSLFINPTITKKVRFKLCMYSSTIYFLIMLFSFLFKILWLQYVALVVPLIYSWRTFSHIIRVGKQ